MLGKAPGRARFGSNRVAGALRASANHRRFLPLLAVVVVALLLPSAWAGVWTDDYVLLAILSGSGVLGDVYPSRLDIFNFFDGSPARTRRLLDLGLLPWWTFPEVKVAFWRPASALTHWLDHALWRDLPALMHVHSLLWFGGLVIAVGAMYRRLIGPGWVAGVAALLYALDGPRAGAVIGIAGRNALLATLFAALTLLFHDRWRRDGWRAGSIAGPFCLALALLSTEGAVATSAYLVAYAVFLDHGTWRRRLLALLPHGIVVAAWQLLYTGLGFGVFAAAPAYLSPLREPLQFARAVASNGPILLLAQWTGPPATSFSQLSLGAAGARWAATVLGIAVLGTLLAPLFRKDPVARFWGLGQVLAVMPACAALPDDRYLFFVGLGAMGLLAQFLRGLLDQAWWQPGPRLWNWPAALLACALVAIHLVVSPLQMVRRVTGPGEAGGVEERAAATIPTDPAVRDQVVVIVSVPRAVMVSYSFFIRTVKGHPIPARTRVLASGGAQLSLYRPDARTLRMRWEGPQERMFRAREDPMVAPAQVRLAGIDIEVTGVTRDGLPAEATFRFDADLDDPVMRWLRWSEDNQRGGFVGFSPPSIGETVLVR